MLGLTQVDLASRIGASVTFVANIERGATKPKQATLQSIQTALEAAGIEFLFGEDGGGDGIRFRGQEKANTDLDAHIETLKANLPYVDETALPSPAKAMRQLERAHGKNEIAKARGRRAKPNDR